MFEESHFGPWVVEHPIGRGGMAVVYRCHHVDDVGRLAAVKVLVVEHSAERLARLDLEVRLLRRLDHPHIVQVLDHSLGADESWIALELVDGAALDQALPGRQSTATVVDVGAQIAEALVYLHRSGVWHRDIKPANLLVERAGRVRLVDFGIAVAADEARLTAEDHRAPVTLSYAPPEWFDEEPPSPAPGDAYALGVVLWELFTGTEAFSVSGGSDLMADVCLRKNATPFLDPGPEVPASVREVVVGLTAADVERRWTVTRALERLQAVRGSALDGTSTPAPPLPRPPPLPEPRDEFVGRHLELDQLAAWLDEGVRLVTVLGPPGTGKTRFALRAAIQQRRKWSGGVWFVDLSEARDAEGIRRAVSRALGIPLVAHDPELQLAEALAAMGRVLLVLDNLEQVAAHALDTVGRWVGATPQAAFVCTSREHLRLSGERVLSLAPLGLPEPGASPEEILASEAVALFVERARAVAPGLTFSGEALTRVAQLVRALDGLPLAIELAAARAPVLTPTEMMERLSRPLSLVGSGARDGLSRHRTLRAALDASWTLLSEAEQHTLAQVTVFEGGLSLDAAEAVVQVDGDVLDALQGLVDRSWLLLRRREGGFGLLSTVRAYAAEYLETLGEREAVELRHGQHFAGLARAPYGRVVRLPSSSFSNLRVAFDRALARGDVAVATRTALVLGRAAYRLGPLGPSLERIPLALALPAPPSLDRVRLMSEHTKLLERGLQDGAAKAQAQQALDEALRLGDPQTEGLARMELGRLGWLERPAEETLAELDQGLDCLRRAEAPSDLVWGLCLRANLGHALRVPPGPSLSLLDEAVATLERHPDPYLLSMVLAVQAMVGDRPLDPMIRLARRNGFRAMWLDAMCMAGIKAVDAGDLDRGEDLLSRAGDGARRLGYKGRRADCATALADIALRRGDVDAATRFCDEVHELRGEGPEDAHPLLCNQRGLIAAGRGDHAGAQQWFERCHERSVGHPHALMVEMLALRGELLAGLGWRAGARAALQEAERLVAKSPLPEGSAVGKRLARARAVVRRAAAAE